MLNLILLRLLNESIFFEGVPNEEIDDGYQVHHQSYIMKSTLIGLIKYNSNRSKAVDSSQSQQMIQYYTN
jgi:hypothetical protein